MNFLNLTPPKINVSILMTGLIIACQMVFFLATCFLFTQSLAKMNDVINQQAMIINRQLQGLNHLNHMDGGRKVSYGYHRHHGRRRIAVVLPPEAD